MCFSRGSTVLLVAVVIVSIGLAMPAWAVNNYASCIKCHALPINQAMGQLDFHAGYYLPEFPEGACFGCHMDVPHDEFPPEIYLWNWPLDPFSYPPGPSVITQMCEDCHDGVMAPGPESHPNDVIPYLAASIPDIYPPNSILPLFKGDGTWNQDPSQGGIACGTCHNAHEPALYNSTTGFPTFLRMEGSYAICSVCHFADIGGADLYIERTTSSVTYWPDPYSGLVGIDAAVKNRGNVPSMGVLLDVRVELPGGIIEPVEVVPVPPLMPEETAIVSVLWDGAQRTGEEVFHFILDPSELDPMRWNEFVSTINSPPAPENLRVVSAGQGEVYLEWDPPMNATEPLEYNVYRNGRKVNVSPALYTSYMDSGLAPETPHTYTVEAVDMYGNKSPMSNRVGAETLAGMIIRVPDELPTINDALAIAQPGTSIHVAPGTYSEPINMDPFFQVTIKGRDANGCVIDMAGVYPQEINLGQSGQNSISGFTIRNSSVFMRTGDTVSSCAIVDSPGNGIIGGGMVTNCVFDYNIAPSINVPPDEFMMAANSIFLTTEPIVTDIPDSDPVYLLNNDFVYWYDWPSYPGRDNFSADPVFFWMGTYFLKSVSPCIDNGADVGLMFDSNGPDVGVFEYGFRYTAKPSEDISSYWEPFLSVAHLDWLPSPDDPLMVLEYWIYKSEVPYFPPVDIDFPYAVVPAAFYSYDDPNCVEGMTYYYQVRAFSGYPQPPEFELLLSAPSPTSSVTIPTNNPPVAEDDAVEIFEDASSIIYVLANDYDVDGDPLFVDSVTQPAYGSVTNNYASVSYTPRADFNGIDTFTYVAADGRGGFDDATVIVDVKPVNDPPDAFDDTAGTVHDTPVDIDVLGNDQDIDGDSLMVDSVTQPSNGSVVNNGVNVTYTPAGGYYGTDFFEYTVIDGMGGADTAGVTVIISQPVLLVASIEMATLTAKGKTWAEATPLVIDDIGVPSDGASVSGHWEGLTADNDSGTTAADGTVKFDSDALKKPVGNFCFVIDSVVKEGAVFDPGAGVISNCIEFPPPIVCTDGDTDGYSIEGGDCGPVDCDDTDFFINPGAEELCADTVDNDCDGLADTEDPDCGAPVEICSDGIDNDGDLLVDCDDPDCFGDELCCLVNERGQCADGLDNDCDGQVDCADKDCRKDPLCQ